MPPKFQGGKLGNAAAPERLAVAADRDHFALTVDRPVRCHQLRHAISVEIGENSGPGARHLPEDGWIGRSVGGRLESHQIVVGALVDDQRRAPIDGWSYHYGTALTRRTDRA